ncbi:hypothetical protein NQ314_001953 [Rhamnusium bicolor]|uniref:Uncharacterized protein n=1 Tax=Rhamnusium bicolor TaxID=1586634 RepID=A0AAV8ZTS0_9CUCU|nr:hypothetical protein NQ314_001953 [Rhamnusium bicolor]
MLTENIIKTPQKIRDELRNILQEFLFMRVKPVYKGEFEYTPKFLERSQSCPDLILWRNMNSPTMARKRAMSECYKHAVLHKVQSDMDLERIDKERTFRPSDAFMHQKDLLLKVVDALTATSDGDRGILGVERCKDSSTAFKLKRRRAVSDVRPPTKFTPITDGHTWYGNDASKALTEFNQRKRTFSTPVVEKQDRQTIFQRIRNRFKIKDDKNVDIEKQVAEDSRRQSIHSANVELNRRRYSTISASQEQVLEQTSIADFIRALTAITVPETKFESGPRRKLGTASLTPPNITPARRRRMSIRPNVSNRRASLIPSTTIPQRSGRRYSLGPLDENLLTSPPPYSFHPPEARNSFRSPQGRRFSVRPTYSNITGPVKRQVNKRERTDNDSER